MPQNLPMLDISQPLLAAQKFKANQLTLKDAQQTMNDRKLMRDIRGKLVTKNSLGDTDLDQLFVIDPQNAMAVTQSIAKIREMKNPSQVLSEDQRNKLIQGFAVASDTPEKWKENLPYLEKNGIKASEIGNYSDNNRALLLAITGKIDQEVKKKLATIGVGNGQKQVAFVAPGQEPELVGKPFSSGGSGKGGGQGKYGLKTADANFFDRKARNFHGSFKNEITGKFNALDPEKETSINKMAALAEEIYAKEGGSRNAAFKKATQIIKQQYDKQGTGNQPEVPSNNDSGINDRLQLRQFLNGL